MYSELVGLTVVLTREDNTELAWRLRGVCAEVIELPCVRTEPLDDTRALEDAVAPLESDDWLVITSRHGADAVARCGRTRASIAAVGRSTAARLAALGYIVDFTPHAANGEALARELPMRSGIVVLARSDRALPDLPRLLRTRGFTVHEIVAYRTDSGARGDVARVRTLLGSTDVRVAVLFHSPSAIEGMLAAVDADLVRRASIFVGGGSTLRAARELLGPAAHVSVLQEEMIHVAHR